jgi:predicted NAD-dependent protein-ADP-ribosyltransferase YbiA (DUF1768 family)
MSSASSSKRKYVDNAETIYFKSNKANGNAWLSNFWPFCEPKVVAAVPGELQSASASLTVDNITYSSVEHYFHASKYRHNKKACERKEISKKVLIPEPKLLAPPSR